MDWVVPLTDGCCISKQWSCGLTSGLSFAVVSAHPWGDRGIGEPVQDWMLSAMKGDRTQVEVLRAYLNAVVTGRLDLQRYLECMAPVELAKELIRGWQ